MLAVGQKNVASVESEPVDGARCLQEVPVLRIFRKLSVVPVAAKYTRRGVLENGFLGFSLKLGLTFHFEL